MRFRKKPIVIEATQWFKNGDHPEDYAAERPAWDHEELTAFSGEHAGLNGWEGDIVRYFRHPQVDGTSLCPQCRQTMHVHGFIDTLEGGHRVCPGDWIIRGVKGELYPCKSDIFEATYEPVEGPNPAVA